jgi:hypothetical protein
MRRVLLCALAVTACQQKEERPRGIDVDRIEATIDQIRDAAPGAASITLAGVVRDQLAGAIELPGVDGPVGVTPYGELVLAARAAAPGTTVEIAGQRLLLPAEPPGVELRIPVELGAADQLLVFAVEGAGGARAERIVTLDRTAADRAVALALATMPTRVATTTPPPRSIAWRGRLLAGPARTVREIDLVALEEGAEVVVHDRRTGREVARRAGADEAWLRGLVE